MFAKTFLDVSSKKPVNTDGWQRPDYDDSQWETCTMPKNHGTERHEGEALLLRKCVEIKDFEKAYFELESLFPSGELWVNGKVVEVLHDAHRKMVDVTKYLTPNAKNLIGLRIDPFHANFKQMMHHSPTDPNIGWFAGRSWLHLTKATHITDVYTYLSCRPGSITTEISVRNTSYQFYKGQLQVLLKEWFPAEGTEFVADSMEIEMQPQETKTFKMRFKVKDLKLWSWQKPQLYQVRALLINSVSGRKTETFSAVDGDLARTRELYIDKLTDDYVVTTGFRTIEQEETIGQMNWSLLRGSPVYKYHSYEWDYDEGSIGRRLTSDEWRESQAWQAFSAYESIRKMRWLDYDGLSWCCMWGGGNMGTYQKPLIDALGHKKLAFYAHRMGFQQQLAGTKDVDLVYGPGDRPTVVVLNLGPSCTADVVIVVRDTCGKQVHRQTIRDISLPSGRTATDVGTLRLPQLPDGYYFFDYQILHTKKHLFGR
jgi:hypothetical protein